MRSTTTTIAVVLRHLNVRHALVDTVTGVTVGTLSALVLMLSSQLLIDTALFESGMGYASRVEGVDPSTASASRIVVVVSDDAYVNNAGTPAKPETSTPDGPMDLTESVRPAIWSYTGTAAAMRSLLSASGTREPIHGAFVDEATASALGVSMGSTIKLVRDVDDEWRECSLEVAGITRPYVDVSRDLAGGLVAIPLDTCREVVEDDSALTVSFEMTGVPDPAEPKASWVEHAIRTAAAPQVSGLVIPVLLVGTVLWMFITWRLATRLRDSVAPAARVLHSLGVTPRTLRNALTLIVSLIAAVTAIGSAFAARAVLDAAADFYIQAHHAALVGLLFGVGAIGVALRTARRLLHHDSRTSTGSIEKAAQA